jgi:hypothetical protein
MPDQPAPRPAKRRLIVLGAVLVGAVIGFAAVSNMDRLRQQAAPGDPTCAPAIALSKKIEPLARGEVAGLTMARTPLKLPDLARDRGVENLVNRAIWAEGNRVPSCRLEGCYGNRAGHRYLQGRYSWGKQPGGRCVTRAGRK